MLRRMRKLEFFLILVSFGAISYFVFDASSVIRSCSTKPTFGACYVLKLFGWIPIGTCVVTHEHLSKESTGVHLTLELSQFIKRFIYDTTLQISTVVHDDSLLPSHYVEQYKKGQFTFRSNRTDYDRLSRNLTFTVERDQTKTRKVSLPINQTVLDPLSFLFIHLPKSEGNAEYSVRVRTGHYLFSSTKESPSNEKVVLNIDTERNGKRIRSLLKVEMAQKSHEVITYPSTISSKFRLFTLS